MAKTAVPDRGDNPKRRIKYSDMSVNKMSPSGGHEISHMADGQRKSQKFIGYSKREAMKRYRDSN